MLEAMPGIKCHDLETSTSSFGAVMATFNGIIFFFLVCMCWFCFHLVVLCGSWRERDK